MPRFRRGFRPILLPLEERTLLSSDLEHLIRPAGLAAAIRIAAPKANPVVAWNAVALDAIRADRTAPPIAARDLAIVQSAVYDAVNSIVPIGQAYGVRVAAPHGASLAGAVAGAAHEALVKLFPAQATTLDAKFFSALTALGITSSTFKGVAVGTTVADRELALRADDGSSTAVTHATGTAPGQWQPTPPAFARAVLPQWGKVTPFLLRSGSQLRPAGLPTLNSVEYAAALNEVESLGARDSTSRTAEQTDIALFWADGAGTMTPPGHWNQIAEQVAVSRRDSLLRSARVFATLDLALADAGIACWDAKYADNCWRPITAIRQADIDDNPATTADPTWEPLLTTPAFPSYVSGHSTFSAAAATVLAAVYGPNLRFTTTSDGLPGATRTYTSFADAAAEAGMSRIYGGIHFSFDNRDGLTLGRAIGRRALGRLG